MQYTKQDGTIGQLPTNEQQEAFAQRAMEMLADLSVGEVTLSHYLFTDSPFEHVKSNGEGGLSLTPALLGTPQFEWMIDIMAQKMAQQAPTGDHYTMSMSEVLERSKFDELILRRLVDREVLDAKLIDGVWMFADNTLHKTNDLARAHTITTAQAAELRGCAEITIRKQIESGRLPAIKIANRWKIRPEDVDTMELENRGPRTDVLNVRCGRHEHIKMLFKADAELDITERFTGGIEGKIEGQWRQAVVMIETKTGEQPKRRCWRIRYSRSETNELAHGPFFAKGKFEIEEHTNNSIESKRMYDAFVKELS